MLVSLKMINFPSSIPKNNIHTHVHSLELNVTGIHWVDLNFVTDVLMLREER